jgi:hypothetical protein
MYISSKKPAKAGSKRALPELHGVTTQNTINNNNNNNSS